MIFEILVAFELKWLLWMKIKVLRKKIILISGEGAHSWLNQDEFLS